MVGMEAGNRRKARPDVEPQAEGCTRHWVGNLEPVDLLGREDVIKVMLLEKLMH